MKPSFAIVGCGKVGKALGQHLLSAGYSLTGISTQSMASAKKAAKIVGTKYYSVHSWEITQKADIVFITTPDGVIEDVCTQITQNNGFKRDAVVLHCSGAHPSTILSSAQKCGANIGSIHPLQSFSAQSSGNTFNGIVISVEGDQKAVTTATQIANDLGANC
ncbi:MAG: NAD(P)-binding domain-containing protein, partial [Desulfobacterales bacterium]|nr:NAD(P)-binding domain-containing protein [Desulfobacterales bacterium]